MLESVYFITKILEIVHFYILQKPVIEQKIRNTRIHVKYFKKNHDALRARQSNRDTVRTSVHLGVFQEYGPLQYV